MTNFKANVKKSSFPDLKKFIQYSGLTLKEQDRLKKLVKM